MKVTITRAEVDRMFATANLMEKMLERVSREMAIPASMVTTPSRERTAIETREIMELRGYHFHSLNRQRANLLGVIKARR